MFIGLNQLHLVLSDTHSLVRPFFCEHVSRKMHFYQLDYSYLSLHGKVLNVI